jgi:D-alanyl-D-alanine carboxypeptidase (penicillin-binding protein 5/6)
MRKGVRTAVGPARFAAVAALLVLIVAALGFVAGTAHAAVFETKARHALLLDVDTGTILFQKAADERMPPASMSKLMTTAVIFDAVKAGKLSLDQEFTVSENAWRSGGASSGGSTMFAKLGSSIKVSDLIRGVVVQSGNDACIVFAEGMAGSEAAFADMMNAEARKIGLTGSHFANATGLPDPQQYMTAHDLARLAEYIITSFPDFYEIYGEREFTWNKIRQPNRNPLLDMNIGADGLKTGFTEESGYGLVGSAVQNGQRLILVMNGLKSEKERSEEARKLLEWGFRSFERVELFATSQAIVQADVFGGTADTVGVVPKGTLPLLIPHGQRDQIKARVVYQGPLKAPVREGQEIGKVTVSVGDDISRDAPVFASDDVPVGTVRQRALDGLKELLVGWW